MKTATVTVIEYQTETTDVDGIEVTEAVGPRLCLAELEDLKWLMDDCMSTPYATVREVA